ncbi:MAG: CPBP family intramembrane metalloprotease [Euzebyales bacterium]|nr:CPBP family intramembrane metalloprotease [Euzebyales bacterium]MBA3620811.1 CPBP family intramembrane metalloprotease [Euzebyales bacterium]
MAGVPWGVRDAVAVFGLYFVGSALAGYALAGAATAPTGLIVSSLLWIAILVGWIRLRFGGHARELLGRARPRSVEALIGLGAGIGIFVVVILGFATLLGMLIQLTGNDVPVVQQEFRTFSADPATAPLFAVGAVLLGPLAEELFFRGLLYPALRKRIRVWPAVAVSGLVFAFSHLQATPAGYGLVVAIIFPVGMLLAWLFEWRKSLLAPIVAHAAYNCIQVGVLILAGEPPG